MIAIKKKYAYILLFIALLYVTGTAYAFVFGGSNLYSGYPRFNPYATPSTPYRTDAYSAQNYRNQVQNYVNEAETYISNANNDIQAIREAQRNARNNANHVVDAYNRWIDRY